MLNRFMALLMVVFAGLQIFFMFAHWPSPWCVLWGLFSLWFTHRAIWWWEQGSRLVPGATAEQNERLKEAMMMAQDMVRNGVDKKEAEEWLRVKVDIIMNRRSEETSEK